jgi:hypothetical protein
MSAAYFIVLERAIPGLDTGMDGKGISRSIKDLDGVARKLGVHPLSGFLSASPEQVTDPLEEDGVDSDLAQTKNFPAWEGLSTLRALLAHEAVLNDAVERDLWDCVRILTRADQELVGWHFELNF